MDYKRIFSLFWVVIFISGWGVAHAETFFSDVPANHSAMQAIRFLVAEEIVQGYADQTFKPDATINRAEFTKIVVGAVADPGLLMGCTKRNPVPFSDVPDDAWFTSFICRAHQLGMVKGYSDGSFRPGETINVAEAAKIIVKAFRISTEEDALWYRPAIEALAERKALPLSIERVDAPLTRGQMAQLIWRISENIISEASRPAYEVLYDDCLSDESRRVSGIDLDHVRRTWLAWINVERAKNNLPLYTLNSQLNRSASMWSNYLADTKQMTHKRPGQQKDFEYHYDTIEEWFEELSLVFANRDRHTFTENVGRGYFVCKKRSCTQDLVDAIRTTFDLYLSEEGEGEQPHYSSMTSEYFQEIGFGVTVDEQGEAYYLTVHYGTWLTEDAGEVCP